MSRTNVIASEKAWCLLHHLCEDAPGGSGELMACGLSEPDVPWLATVVPLVVCLQAKMEQKDLSGVEMEFGLGFNTEMKVYVVGAKAEASLKVKLTWKSSDQE